MVCVEPNSNTRVKGIVTAISPMKAGKSCKCYDGEISSPKCYENSKPVLLDGYEIKKLDKEMV